MEKRVFLAILLSFLVLLFFQWYLAPQAPPATSTTAETGAAGAPTSTTPAQTSAPGTPAPAQPAAAASTPAAPTSGPAVKSTAPPSGAAPVIADTAAHTSWSTPTRCMPMFSTRGATLKSWQLKKYLRTTTGKPLDLVPEALPSDFVKPFTLDADDPALSATLASALYRPSAASLSLGGSDGTLTFEYQDASGLHATQDVRVPAEVASRTWSTSSASVDVRGAARPVTLDWGPALGLGYSAEGSRFATPPAAVQMQAGNVERPSVKDLQQQPAYERCLSLRGVDDQYFLSAALPEGKSAAD